MLDLQQTRALIDSGDVEQKRVQIQAVLGWLFGQSQDGPTAGAARRETDVADAINIVQTKTIGVPGLASSALAQLTASLSIVSPKVIEILAPLLAAVAKDESASARDAATQRIIKADWPPLIVGALCLSFSDLVLAPQTRDLLVVKLVRCMQAAQLSHLANLVRFLLILAKSGDRKRIVQEILSFMNTLDSKLGNSEDQDWQDGRLSKEKTEIIRIEGTLILQICFAVRQNQELGTDLLLLLKSGNRSNISSFEFSLLLAMSQIHRFETSALDALKSIITTACKDFEYRHGSRWIPDEAKQELCPITVWNVLHRIILKSEHWDNLAPDLCNFAFLLIEGSHSTPVLGANRIVLQEHSDTTLWGVFDLGSWVLLELCRRHEPVVATVVDQILSRIITKPMNILTYSYIFEEIARRMSSRTGNGSSDSGLLQFGPKILEVLNCLGEVPVNVCDRFLWCIKPLFQSGSSFRDSVLIPLRKGLFSSELASRKVSIATLIYILKLVEAPSESGSQNMISSHDSEIFYILRRGMNQQYDIRVQLYQGFLSIIENQLWLASTCLDLLIPQFTRYYEESAAIKAPLRLDMCFHNNILQEPLPHLMTAIVSAVLAAKEKGRDVTEYVLVFDNILERLIKADLSDFDIDKDADYVSDGEESKKARAVVDVLLGVYDTAIEYAMLDDDMKDSQVDLVIGLHRKSSALRAFMKDKMKSKKGFGNKFVHHPSSCILATRVKVLRCLFGPMAIPRLRSSADFTQQAINDTIAVLTKTTTIVSNPQDQEEHIISLGQLLFSEILKKTTVGIYPPKSPDRAIFGSAVECFEKLTAFVLTDMPDSVHEFLDEIVKACGTEDGTQDGEIGYVDRFVIEVQKLIADVLVPQYPYPREAVLLIKCLGDLWTFLSKCAASTNVEYELEKLEAFPIALQDWALNTWGSYQSLDSALSKSLVGLFCKLQKMAPDTHKIGKFVSGIQKSFPFLLENDDAESQDFSDFDAGEIAEKDVSPIITMILSNVEENIDEARWILSKLKQHKYEDVEDLRIESVIYSNVMGVIDVLWSILRSELPFDAADIVFGSMIRVFKLVNGILKYKTLNPGRLGNRFEKLIDLVTAKLRDGVTDIIPVMQERDARDSEVGGEAKKMGAAKLFKKRKRSSRESKTMPALIFETEQFDRYLIALHKKQKSNINLMKYVKRSTARDFKIKENVIAEKDGLKKEKKQKNEK
ncbi:FANCI solenoid 4-domain-containing protein [Obelidium mucronatum]|nr:FANCI solenoid 4-domain-containing protein [Obelidium mucronatum]